MSLRTRLLSVITASVALVVLTLAALLLNSLLTTLLDHAAERAQAAGQFVKTYVLQRTAALPGEQRPLDSSVENMRALWRQAIATDPELPALLAATMAQSRAMVEVSIAGEAGQILASSNPARTGAALERRLPLSHLQQLNPIDRFTAIFRAHVDYESRVVLGLAGQTQPVFTIQVLISSVLLREALLPDLRRAALLSGAALLLALVTAYAAASLVLRSLAGLSRAIDRISVPSAAGAAPAAAAAEPAARFSGTREFQVVEEKLRLLGAQVRGAEQDASRLRGGVEQMLERIEEAVLLYDSAGQAVLCAQAAERMLEMPRTQILAQPLARLFPPSAPVAASVAERRPLRNAHVGNLLVSLDPLPGAQGGFLLRLREAGGREAVASQLSIASRLSAIGRLTGGVAHEIKNPLNSIALRLGLLRNRVLPEVPDAEPEIDIIAAEIARLNRVVRTFLDFTRPVDLRLAGFDLAATVASILDLVRPEAERLKIELALGAPAGPLPLRGDEALLRQAVLNVVHNALEAMPLGGTLHVVLAAADGAAELCIADTGPGLPEEVIGKVFQLYFSTKEKGSGIGLAMAFRAVQLHGGSITAENRPGGGALFRIRVPMERVSE